MHKKWRKLQETADLVTFTEENLNENLHFLWSVYSFRANAWKIMISPVSKGFQYQVELNLLFNALCMNKKSLKKYKSPSG